MKKFFFYAGWALLAALLLLPSFERYLFADADKAVPLPRLILVHEQTVAVGDTVEVVLAKYGAPWAKRVAFDKPRSEYWTWDCAKAPSGGEAVLQVHVFEGKVIAHDVLVPRVR